MNYTVPGRPPQFISPVQETAPSIVYSSTRNSAPSIVATNIVEPTSQEEINKQLLSVSDNTVPPPSLLVSQQDQNSVKHHLSSPRDRNDEPGLYQAPEDDSLLGICVPVKPLIRPATLQETCYVLPYNQVFVDKILPPLECQFVPNSAYPLDYFVGLHSIVSAPTVGYPANTPNYLGARIPLHHTSLNIQKWRQHLIGYENADIVQFLEYGFPLGLSDNPPPVLKSSLRNHGSSYQYYPYLDEFLATGLERCELAGPCLVPPFPTVHVSPLMTAVKKPAGRRAVFDGTFGEYSLNNGTPTDMYMNDSFTYDFPKVEDFKRFVLENGSGCYIYKRDLSRYYLQLPIDPTQYPLLCVVWRKFLFFFLAFMFGLRHAGLQGQRVTKAVTWIHRRLGLESDTPRLFNSLNYSDDIGGCEDTLERATEAYDALGNLFTDLGLKESASKAHPPATTMPYLGIQFNTVKMTMSIPPDKICEVREEVSLWMKKSFATKKTLQQLLGKLFWVSRCVKYSRGFMGRLLAQLQLMHTLPDNKKAKLSEGCREDVAWWDRYLRRFNGVEILYASDPLGLTLDQLLDTEAHVNCGDAQPLGGGSYFGSEYWSRPFPPWLQSDTVPIHIKEFWVVIVSAWIWGEQWQGRMVYIFCDNSAVVEVLDKERPKDPGMQELLREFLYIVCTRRFTPIFRKIGTTQNSTADFISRCHDPHIIDNYFKTCNLPVLTPVVARDTFFTLRANW